jgi:hypothetical protein
MGDGAGSLVYVGGSGVTALLTINADGSINVNMASGDTVGIDSGASVKVLGSSGLALPQTASGTLRVLIVGSGEVDIQFATGASDSNGVNRNNLAVANYNLAYDRGANSWRRVDISRTGTNALQVASSGLDTLTITSGQGVVTSISGNILTARMSGETLKSQIPTAGRARGVLQVTGNSGGDLLASGDTNTVTIRMLTKASGGTLDASGFILIGFDAAGERPYVGGAGNEFQSGYGTTILYPGDAYTVAVDNMNRLRVVASRSGEMIIYGGNVY